MKMGRSLALMALGAGATIAYQKYSKPVMRKAEKAFDKTVKKTGDKLDHMM
ncbi:MAG TPA: hypothetical protein GX747_00090 [Tenericutes bacterium]|nr:hypothetical protein [Mycoplasmatota bacterium]